MTDALSQQQFLPGMGGEKPHYDFSEPVHPGRVHPEHQLSMSMPPYAAVAAVRENRFRNMFETPDGHAGAWGSYEEGRRAVEHRLFGIPTYAGGEERPVYGMLRQKGTLNYPENDKLATPEYAGNRTYGTVMADIKAPHPDQHVTATHGDSMDDEPGRAAELKMHSHSPLGPDMYTEVQWHDRPSPREDIEAVHMVDDPLGGRLRGLTNFEIGNASHKQDVAEGRVNAERVASDLREAGLTAPIHHWEKAVRYQPSLFESEGIPGKRTEDWRRRSL